MKTFNRASLPQSIAYNGKTYVRGEKTAKSVKVLVLSSNLKKRTDLYNRPYTPTEWFFNPIS